LNAPAWLTERPIAHRGLHDSAKGVIENTIGAAEAAIAAHCAIECDVQLSRDGEAMVFHDDSLGRLTRARGPLAERSLAELQRLVFRGGDDHIPTLPEFLTRLASRTPLICELKSRFDGDMRLAERVAAIARQYAGPIALKSFDPAVIAHLRARHDGIAPLGMVAEGSYSGWHWRGLTAEQKRDCAAFTHFAETRPDFLSWNINDLPHPTPYLLRSLAGLPVIVWTVRTPAQRRVGARFADQIVFEGSLS
jgi:glycerophosphoryl diester phosphodiesterase